MDAPGHGAGFKSDSYVPANRRVYDSPELFDTIMSYMSVKQVAVLLRLEKAAIERVMDHLGCRMVYSALELDEEAVITGKARDLAVRYIVETSMDFSHPIRAGSAKSNDNPDIASFPAFTALLARCPKLRTLSGKPLLRQAVITAPTCPSNLDCRCLAHSCRDSRICECLNEVLCICDAQCVCQVARTFSGSPTPNAFEIDVSSKRLDISFESYRDFSKPHSFLQHRPIVAPSWRHYNVHLHYLHDVYSPTINEHNISAVLDSLGDDQNSAIHIARGDSDMSLKLARQLCEKGAKTKAPYRKISIDYVNDAACWAGYADLFAMVGAGCLQLQLRSQRTEDVVDFASQAPRLPPGCLVRFVERQSLYHNFERRDQAPWSPLASNADRAQGEGVIEFESDVTHLSEERLTKLLDWAGEALLSMQNEWLPRSSMSLEGLAESVTVIRAASPRLRSLRVAIRASATVGSTLAVLDSRVPWSGFLDVLIIDYMLPGIGEPRGLSRVAYLALAVIAARLCSPTTTITLRSIPPVWTEARVFCDFGKLVHTLLSLAPERQAAIGSDPSILSACGVPIWSLSCCLLEQRGIGWEDQHSSFIVDRGDPYVVEEAAKHEKSLEATDGKGWEWMLHAPREPGNAHRLLPVEKGWRKITGHGSD